MSPDIIIGSLIAGIAFIGMVLDMPQPETYGPPDDCSCGGKFCPDSDPDHPSTCKF